MVRDQFAASNPVILKKNKFIEKVDKILLLMDEKLSVDRNETEYTGNYLQLEKIKKEVECMRRVLSYKEFNPTYPRTIVDSWDYTDALGIELLEIFDEYTNL